MAGRPLRPFTVAHVAAIEIVLVWRWLPIVLLGTVLLGHSVLPVRFPTWGAGTWWVTSLAVVLGGEAALLLHELSHALVARRCGLGVERIIFHGLFAETIIGAGLAAPRHALAIALSGPVTNLALALGAATVRSVLGTEAALDVFLLALLVGNLVMAGMSLMPTTGSDGARALEALRRVRSLEGQIAR
jgi:Zn-dependent protease